MQTLHHKSGAGFLLPYFCVISNIFSVSDRDPVISM